MRIILALTMAAATVTSAHAETGVFVEESLGGAGATGDLQRFGSSGPRLQAGVGVRHDAWAVKVSGLFVAPSFFFIDCYGDECNQPLGEGYGMVAVDVQRRWTLARPRWTHTGVFAFAHAGPRWAFGDGALRDMHGPGVGLGGGITGDLKVFAYFIDLGVDAMWLHGPIGPPTLARTVGGGGPPSHPAVDIAGTAPYFVIGCKIGWM